MDPNQPNNQNPQDPAAAPVVPMPAPMADPSLTPQAPAVQPPPSIPVAPVATEVPSAVPQAPIAPAAPAPAPQGAAPQAQVSNSGKKNILLVDDERETSTVFQVGLSTGGYNVTLAENGKSALDAAKQARFDLILLDQMMPDMSGNDVLRALKADEATRSVPIAMLTNFGHDEMVKEALNLGANDYILKYRVEAKDLVEKVQSLIGL